MCDLPLHFSCARKQTCIISTRLSRSGWEDGRAVVDGAAALPIHRASTERPARGGAFVLTTAPVSYDARCAAIVSICCTSPPR